MRLDCSPQVSKILTFVSRRADNVGAAEVEKSISVLFLSYVTRAAASCGGQRSALPKRKHRWKTFQQFLSL